MSKPHDDGKKRILVADVFEAHYRISRALHELYTLRFVTTLSDAKSKLLSEDFDLVVSGVHFDDSRMLQLLDFVAKDERLRDVSFLVVQAQPSQADAALKTVKRIAPMLGACEALHVCELNDGESDQALQEAVRNCIGKSVKERRATA